MRIPPIKYFFQPKRWNWFIMSLMKKYLTKHGELLSKPLTKAQMFTITKRVVNSYTCFEQGYCEKCKCDMVDVINMESYACKQGCFGIAPSEEEFDEYSKLFKNEFSNIVTKR